MLLSDLFGKRNIGFALAAKRGQCCWLGCGEFLDDALATLGGQHAAGESAEFVRHFAPAQRVFRIAFGVAHEFFVRLPVAALDRDPRGPLSRESFLDGGIFYQRHLGHHLRDIGREYLLQRELIESGCAVENRDGRAERHRELCVHYGLGVIFLSARFTDNVPSGFEDGDLDLGDVPFCQMILAHDF